MPVTGDATERSSRLLFLKMIRKLRCTPEPLPRMDWNDFAERHNRATHQLWSQSEDVTFENKPTGSCTNLPTLTSTDGHQEETSAPLCFTGFNGGGQIPEVVLLKSNCLYSCLTRLLPCWTGHALFPWSLSLISYWKCMYNSFFFLPSQLLFWELKCSITYSFGLEASRYRSCCSGASACWENKNRREISEEKQVYS